MFKRVIDLNYFKLINEYGNNLLIVVLIVLLFLVINVILVFLLKNFIII